MIGDRYGIHAKRLRAGDEIRDAARTIKKAVACMNVQMRKGNLRHGNLAESTSKLLGSYHYIG